MKLLFKRDQYQSWAAKTIFKLYAKIELEDDEDAILNKYDFDRAKLVAAIQPTLLRNTFILGLIISALVWMNLSWINIGLFLIHLTIGFAFTTFFYGIPLSLAFGAFIGWLYYDHKRETIFVRDLLFGRYFKCKSVIDLARKEAWLGVVTSFLRQVMESAKNWDGTEVQDIAALTKNEAKYVVIRGL